MAAFQSGELDEAKPLSPRKQALLDQAECSGGEQYRGGKYNGAYREDDLRFTQFLVPPGKRVLGAGLRPRRPAGFIAALPWNRG